MNVAICVAHAAFLPERRATLERLVSQIGGEVHVAESLDREHASTWSWRLYALGERTGADIVCFLNDDVTVCPDFVKTLEAMHASRPNDVIALHSTFPMAQMLLEAKQRWYRSFWLTGPGYSMSMERLRSLRDYISRLPRWFVQSRNEDNVAMQWMWHEQRPAWHPIPAVVKHDVTVPSSLGYDRHPLRQPTLTWEHLRGTELTTPGFWEQAGTPILFECPWMGSPALQIYQQMVAVR